VRDWFAVLTHAFDVELNGFAHELETLVLIVGDCDATGQVWTPSAVGTGLAALDDDGVRAHFSLHQMPACLRMLRSVPDVELDLDSLIK